MQMYIYSLKYLAPGPKDWLNFYEVNVLIILKQTTLEITQICNKFLVV